MRSRGTRTSNHRRTRPAPRDNGNSALIGGRFSHKPLGAGKRNWRAVGEARTQAQTPPRRAFWGNDLEGTNTGTLLAQRPFGRGARAEFFFLCRWESRRKRLSTRASALASQPNRTAQPRQPGTHRQIGPRAAPCGHFASLVRSTFGLRGCPPIFDLRRINPARADSRLAAIVAGIRDWKAKIVR